MRITSPFWCQLSQEINKDLEDAQFRTQLIQMNLCTVRRQSFDLPDH